MDSDNKECKPDIFDRLMTYGFLKGFEPAYRKHKEFLLYMLFGGGTTIVGIIFFAIPHMLLNVSDITVFGLTIDLNTQISNVISWICAVTFAYLTNRKWVFKLKAHGARGIAIECVAFYVGRLFTLIVENILLNICTQTLSLGAVLAKVLVSIVTIILNYVISKLFVFKKRG